MLCPARRFQVARRPAGVRAVWLSLPLGAAAALLPAATGAVAQDPTSSDPALGEVHFPVSCSSEVRQPFERGVALLHHMTYREAREAFEQVAAADPGCAMAHWGVAMTLFQPLWPTRPGPPELRRGADAVARARSIGSMSERERLFLASAAAFFEAPEGSDYWARIRRWREATERLHRAFPDDPEATAFYALSLLAAEPSDRIAPAEPARAAGLLLSVHESNPRHPGAMHYLVHANDVQGREGESPEIVEEYQRVAPGNPHALHMPTHIYTRLGRWEAVIAGNERAAEAALRFPVGERRDLVWDEFPHAIEYLVYAHLQRGDDEEAAAWMERLLGTERLEPTFKTAFNLASVPARYALERRAWEEARALVPRVPASIAWDAFPWPEAVTWFARGMGAARSDEGVEARRALGRIEELEDRSRASGEELFTRQIGILRLELASHVEQAEGRPDSARALMERAVELEAVTPKHPVTPAPTLPALELLGDLLMLQGRAAEARSAYTRSLELYPGRFGSLLGAARASRAVGEEDAARRFYRRLLEVAATGTRAAELDEARRFVSR